jgi:hypothetical protein
LNLGYRRINRNALFVSCTEVIGCRLALDKLAQLGGHLARVYDPPHGTTVIWRGLSRLTDIELGIMIRVQLVGN